jgi:hypothetical protein
MSEIFAFPILFGLYGAEYLVFCYFIRSQLKETLGFSISLVLMVKGVWSAFTVLPSSLSLK